MFITNLANTCPNIYAFEADFDLVFHVFETADTFEWQDAALASMQDICQDFTQKMRHIEGMYRQQPTHILLANAKREVERVKPIYQSLVRRFYRSLLSSPFRQRLERKWGEILFNKAISVIGETGRMRTYHISELLQEYKCTA